MFYIVTTTVNTNDINSDMVTNKKIIKKYKFFVSQIAFSSVKFVGLLYELATTFIIPLHAESPIIPF